MLRLLAIILSTHICSIYAQEHHAQPEHPTGNIATQQEALQYYNEACELYEKGKISRAKISLQEAINTSFALTEAQIFMGKIMLEENKIDSALYYLYSGIDFHTNQKPHVFFLMFEQGMRMGEYGMVKHCYKHFKKLYGSKSSGKYEAQFIYTVDDFERISESLEIVYNYIYWQPNAHLTDTLSISGGYTNNAHIYKTKEKHVYQLRTSKGKQKWKRAKTNSEIRICFENEDIIILEKNDSLFYAKGNMKLLKPFDEKVNDGNASAQAYYLESRDLLYFVSNRNGSKDIFVAKLTDDFKTILLDSLKDINTKYDEQAPFFNKGVFYFSSNGYPGFGGFDLYHTPDNVILNDIVYPSSVLNMGKPINSGEDENALSIINGQYICNRSNWTGSSILLRFNPLPISNMNYDLKIVPITVADEE